MSCIIGAGPPKNLLTLHIGLRVPFILEYAPKARVLEAIINAPKVYIVEALCSLVFHYRMMESMRIHNFNMVLLTSIISAKPLLQFSKFSQLKTGPF